MGKVYFLLFLFKISQTNEVFWVVFLLLGLLEKGLPLVDLLGNLSQFLFDIFSLSNWVVVVRPFWNLKIGFIEFFSAFIP